MPARPCTVEAPELMTPSPAVRSWVRSRMIRRIKGRTFWNSESIALMLTASAQFGASFFQVAPVAELIRTPQIQFSVRHGAAAEMSWMNFSNSG